MEQDKVSKLSDMKKSVWDEDAAASKNPKPEYTPSYGERWNKIRPTKTIVFWSVVGTVVLTMIVGFVWGGWVTGGTAQETTDDAVIERLSAICLGQFNQDPQKDEKLAELQDVRVYQRDEYVTEQGWATMPGDQEPERNVASECAKLIVQSGQ
ncbi:MAG: hypothetical protein R3194_12435 [Limnobacter sp.]|nr:hypothetical protein [Limnobacter sp.]